MVCRWVDVNLCPNLMESIDANMRQSQPEIPPWFEVGGNRLQLIRKPAKRLSALVDMLQTADKSLKLFFYMFEDDRLGRMTLDILIAACERGVAVEMMIDSFGSNGTPRKFFDPFTQAGGKLAVFSPRFSTSYFVRNHQKMIIADDRSALIGGFNIADDYFNIQQQAEDDGLADDSWEDLGLAIEGPEVANLASYYRLLSNWVYQNNGNMRSLRRMVRHWQSGDDQFRWLLGGPSNRLASGGLRASLAANWPPGPSRHFSSTGGPQARTRLPRTPSLLRASRFTRRCPGLTRRRPASSSPSPRLA